MKVIFLDIDGVLNSANWIQEMKIDAPEQLYGWEQLTAFEKTDVCNIDPKAVGFLNRIIVDTGALVVISSSWRLVDPLPKISRALRFRGFLGMIIGATQGVGVGTRGDEIANWLAHVPVQSYVILDDCDDMLEDQPLILTNPLVGLTAIDAEEAVKILGHRRLRRCEVCRGPGPCLMDEAGGRYSCKNCHSNPSDSFFTENS